MTGQPLVAQAQSLWRSLAGAGSAFWPEGRLEAYATEGSGLCPVGWVGIVRIADTLLVTAPGTDLALRLQDTLNGLDLDVCTDPAALADALDVVESSPPVTLAYLDPNEFLPADTADVIRRPGNDPSLKRLRTSVPKAEAAQSATGSIDSTGFLVREGPDVVSLAGWARWQEQVAQVGVLTATARRNDGLATAVASAAVADAIAEGLLPQWQSSDDAARRVAAKLGFREMGSRINLRLR